MNGLDLETFLRLLRADLGAWAMMGVAAIGLATLVWASWGSRRMLRRCLVMSLLLHIGLVLGGSTVPAVRKVLRGGAAERVDRAHIRQIRVAPLVDAGRTPTRPGNTSSAAAPPTSARLELPPASPRLADVPLRVDRLPVPDRQDTEASAGPLPGPPIAMRDATPRRARPVGALAAVDRPKETEPAASGPPPSPSPVPVDLAEVDPEVPARSAAQRKTGDSSTRADAMGVINRAVGTANRALRSDGRLRPGRDDAGEPPKDRAAGSSAIPPARTADPIPPLASNTRAARGSADRTPASSASTSSSALPATVGEGALAIEHVMPRAGRPSAGGTGLAAIGDRAVVRTPAEVPKVYRQRVEPDRSTRARQAGASAASELAVERALDWLARHQDRDGRWNAAVARYDDGSPVADDRDFTAHCPADEICSGACAYWEADTALTGLALLAFLGAGHTHQRGPHADAVDRGLTFLLREQKSDGDLRGSSAVVGMYCHAMAALALCEGFALTGDERLRDPAARAIEFLVRSRARDKQAWRYKPGAPIGDTSILGWVVMGLKSARETGLSIPDEAAVRRGAAAWLDRVSSGRADGLASYQPGEPVTATMTAEAWVCRQFLDLAQTGPQTTESAEFLLRNESDRGRTNYYYWYYATLALYQQGGEPWARWNAPTRDRIVGLQFQSGHQAGSWEPDESLYGPKGGRIYCTALAALTLEVYYRYLRLYDEPKQPPGPAASPELAAPRRDPAAASFNPEDR